MLQRKPVMVMNTVFYYPQTTTNDWKLIGMLLNVHIFKMMIGVLIHLLRN